MSDSTILMIMLLAFTTRRMVRSAHLAFSPIRFTAPLHSAVPDIYSYEKIHVHTASLGTARWADLSTRHQIKSSPWAQVLALGEGLMWW